MFYLANTVLFINCILGGLILLQWVWSRLESSWKGWMAQRRLNGLQRRLVDKGEELDVCSICNAKHAAVDEVSSKF